MSDIMSDMATKPSANKKASPRKRVTAPEEDRRVFTVRDLNRHPQMVLRAAKKLGLVTIRSRSAESFTLTPSPNAKPQKVLEAEAFLVRQKAYRERLSSLGFVAPSKADATRLEQLIAGE